MMMMSRSNSNWICFPLYTVNSATKSLVFSDDSCVENDDGQQLGSTSGRLWNYGQRELYMLRQDRNTDH